jgi:hypothetical protein
VSPFLDWEYGLGAQSERDGTHGQGGRRPDDGDAPRVSDYLGGTEITVMGALQVACVVLMLVITGVIWRRQPRRFA